MRDLIVSGIILVGVANSIALVLFRPYNILVVLAILGCFMVGALLNLAIRREF